jgi:hypothetical protein
MSRRQFFFFIIQFVTFSSYTLGASAFHSDTYNKYLIFPGSEPAQSLFGTDIRFERLTSEQGLSMSVINSIAQDKQGFMWFVTQDGLNRYDGKKFRIYKHDPDDPDCLVNNYICSVYVDRSGTIWITTHGGVDRFDLATGHFNRVFYSMAELFLSSGSGRCNNCAEGCNLFFTNHIPHSITVIRTGNR